MLSIVRALGLEGAPFHAHGEVWQGSPNVTKTSISEATISEWDGAFAVATWDASERTARAARDHMGLMPLYYQQDRNQIRIADTIDAFGDSQPFDREYIARFVAGRGNPTTDLTIREGVKALPPGSALTWRDGTFQVRRYWQPLSDGTVEISRQEAASHLRGLLTKAILRYVNADGTTWSHLSGGLDSSSIVSLVQFLHEADDQVPQLGGALTFQEPMGHTDDGVFVREVLDRYPLRHVEVPALGPWHHSPYGLPDTDRPSRDYAFYARDHVAALAVENAGGRVMMSGIGPDIYLPNTGRHCADLLWAGRTREAFKEIEDFTIATRGSMLRVAWSHAVKPLFTFEVPGAVEQGLRVVASWFTKRFRQDTEIDARLHMRNRMHGPRGRFYDYQVAETLDSVAEGLAVWRFTPGYTMVHPLLDRRIVEFCLQLPLKLRTDVYWGKPALRGAMKGILPEAVRRRAGGSVLAPLIQEAFRKEQAKLLRLLENPILADLGCIEPARVRQALTSFDVYRTGAGSYLYALLSMETWLAHKTGRWSEA